MTIYKNVPLLKFNTFGLDYTAESMVHLKKEQDALDLFRGEKYYKNPVLILGGGSNILFTSDYKGLVIRAEFDGITLEESNNNTAIISAGAGVGWDNLVDWTVKRGYSGLENLSLIPGTVGASPVQNIGAYGVEVKDFIERVSVISVRDGSVHSFGNSECKFGYRFSVFKGEEKGKYLVTRVYYKLSVSPVLKLNYGSLMEEVKKLGAETSDNVRQAVINIRSNKLPDPEKTGNAGSFFKNPVVPLTKANNLKKDYPLMPLFDESDGFVKLAAGWLIDQCGWKGKRYGEAGVHDKQALVLVNYGKATGKEIFKLSESIRESVSLKFGVELEREVEVVGTI